MVCLHLQNIRNLKKKSQKRRPEDVHQGLRHLPPRVFPADEMQRRGRAQASLKAHKFIQIPVLHHLCRRDRTGWAGCWDMDYFWEKIQPIPDSFKRYLRPQNLDRVGDNIGNPSNIPWSYQRAAQERSLHRSGWGNLPSPQMEWQQGADME